MAVNLTIMVDVSYDKKTDNNIKMINFMSKLEAIFHVWFPSLISVNLALAVLKKIIYMDIYFFFKQQEIVCQSAIVLFVFVLCLVYPMLPVSLDCPFLIAPSVFSDI
jgi:hypothetical protein